MVFSIQHYFRRQVLLLALGLTLLLTLSLGAASVWAVRSGGQTALGAQAHMLALELVSQKRSSPKDIQALLKNATSNPSLVAACVLSEENLVRAALQGPADNPDGIADCAPSAFEAPPWNRYAVRAHMVDPTLPNARGEVVLIGQLPPLKRVLLGSLGYAALISLLFAALCLGLGRRLERMMLRPIRQIASTAQRVTLYKDYSLRVVAGSLSAVPREVETLTDSFNAMLHEIEDRDIRLRRKGDELEKSREAAVVASRAKSQFLANVSHELRTPLNAIIGFSTMLVGHQFGPLGHDKYGEYARDIHDAGRHLLDVINDILDLSKAETGALSVTIEQLSLAKIVEKAMHIVAGQAHARKIDIFTNIPAKLPKMYADRVRLMQILLNLLSNAIKFTPEGGKIIVRAAAEAGKHGIHYFTLEVEDNGIGMSEDAITKAFVNFNQADAGLNRKYEGAGLGLPLTKRLVELHHGKIKIHSVVGFGTTVTVRLTSDPGLMA